jgi:hypothetical protein
MFVQWKMKLSRSESMIEIDSLHLIFINLYIPAPTQHFNLTEIALLLFDSIIVSAICRLYVSSAKRDRWTLDVWGTLFI